MRRIVKTIGSAATSVPMRLSGQNGNFDYSLVVGLTAAATLTYTVEFTTDDPEASYATDFATDATWLPVTGLDGLSANAASNLFVPVSAVRLDVTAFTDGTATLTALAAN